MSMISFILALNFVQTPDLTDKSEFVISLKTYNYVSAKD